MSNGDQLCPYYANINIYKTAKQTVEHEEVPQIFITSSVIRRPAELHQLGACPQCRIHLRMTDLNLHLNKLCKCFMCTLAFEKKLL